MTHKNKKQAAANKIYNRVLFGTYITAQLLFIILRLYFNWETAYKLTLFGYCLLTAVSGWCVRAIFTTRDKARVNDIKENQIGIETHFDIYCLSVFVLFGVALISDWFWLVYLAIPGYITWLGGKYIVNWVFTKTPAEIEAEQMALEKTLKIQKQKERRAQAKGKRRYT